MGRGPAAPRVEVRLAPRSELGLCHGIRRRVFIDEQRVPEALEMDDGDADSTHFLAWRDGRPVGTARLREVSGEAKAERVAVLAEERERGVGRLLMERIEGEALRRGHARLVLNAQVEVIPFYERQGYAARGERFLEAGIPHRHMSKPLSPPSR